MARGRFGFKRPFAIEKEQVIISLQTETEVHEAELESQNGRSIAGEWRPYFEIDSIDRMDAEKISGENVTTSTDVTVNTDENMLMMKDIRMFFSNVRRNTSMDIWQKDVHILPTITTDRRLAEPEHMPKLMVQLSSSRGTGEEFVDEVEDVVGDNIHLSIVDFESGEGTHRAYCESNGITMKSARDTASDILGPRNKMVTDVAFYCIGVEE